MNRSRILPLLGPAAVLYLVTEVAATEAGLDTTAWLVCALAVALATTPLWVQERNDVPGAGRVGWLGIALAHTLVSVAAPFARSLALDLAGAVGVALTGALVLDLALAVPVPPKPLARPVLRFVPWASFAVAALLATLSLAPAFHLFGEVRVFSSGLAVVPVASCVAALTIALAVRILRRRYPSAPEHLATNAWALLGIVPATVLVGIALFVTLGGGHDAGWGRALVVAVSLCLVVSHVVVVDARQRVVASAAVRRVVAATITLGVACTVVTLLRDAVSRDPLSFAMFAAAFALSVAALDRAIVRAVFVLFAPSSGRIFAALEQIERALPTATSLDELGGVVLPPLRAASRSRDASPLLFLLDPPREVRIDLAGLPHIEARAAATALVERVRSAPHDVVIRGAIEETIVRRPDLRGVMDALTAHDALCVVPIASAGELEGLLVVPRGKRRASLTIEELAMLTRLAKQLGPLVATFATVERARIREQKVLASRGALEERIEELEEALARAASEADVLKTSGASERLLAPHVAYSPAMRALLARIEHVAPASACVAIEAPTGARVTQVGHAVHAASGRASGPFVVADCGSVRPADARTALFGGKRDARDAQAHPGWLRLAHGGSLLLLDVPALPLDVQRELADAIGAKLARATDGSGAYPVDARIVVTSRLPIVHLVEASAFEPELATWVVPLTLTVPPLRDRVEDIPSLVLLAVDRACRILGRSVTGLEPAVLDALKERAWLDDERELEQVIEQAVAYAQGPKITLEDLPLPITRERAPDVLDGTYAELERRILVHALARSGSNKTEAARLLGLARSTFQDKLKRAGLDDPKSSFDVA